MNSAKVNSDFGEFIRAQRLRLGLYQSDVAKKLEITQAYYSCIEIASRNVDLSMALRICAVLELDLNDFLTKYKYKKKPRGR